jgi:biopolymer transport protein ExbD
MRRRFSRKARPKEEMTLQITSMADVFTIILVFLLKSFSTGISAITPNNVTLPEVKTASEAVESLKIEVSKNAILMDGKLITKLTDFHFDQTDLEKDLTPRSLNTALVQEMQKHKTPNVKAGDREPSSVTPGGSFPATPETLLVLSDQEAPYSVLKIVLASATNAGFSDFRLVVVEDK